MGRGGSELPEDIDEARETLSDEEFFMSRSELPVESDQRKAYVRRLHILLAKTARRFEHTTRVLEGERTLDTRPELPETLWEAEAYLDGNSFFRRAGDLPDKPSIIGEYIEQLHLQVARGLLSLRDNQQRIRERDPDSADSSGGASPVSAGHPDGGDDSTHDREETTQGNATDSGADTETTGVTGGDPGVEPDESETADEVGASPESGEQAEKDDSGPAETAEPGDDGSSEHAPGTEEESATETDTQPQEENPAGEDKQDGSTKPGEFVFGQSDDPDTTETGPDDSASEAARVERQAGDTDAEDTESSGATPSQGEEPVEPTPGETREPTESTQTAPTAAGVAGEPGQEGTKKADAESADDDSGLSRRTVVAGGGIVAFVTAVGGGGLATFLLSRDEGDGTGGGAPEDTATGGETQNTGDNTGTGDGGDNSGTSSGDSDGSSGPGDGGSGTGGDDGSGTGGDGGSGTDGDGGNDSTDTGGNTGESVFELTDHNVTADPDGEFVELAYVGDGELDISGYMLYDGMDGQAHPTEPRTLDPFSFPDGTTLAQGEPVRVYTGNADGEDDGLSWGYQVNIWNQDGDTVVLQNTSGTVVFEGEYGPRE
jgi:hypothetical protein